MAIDWRDIAVREQHRAEAAEKRAEASEEREKALRGALGDLVATFRERRDNRVEDDFPSAHAYHRAAEMLEALNPQPPAGVMRSRDRSG
jgi:hypothetical protein